MTQQDRSTPTRRWPLSDTHCRHGPGQLGFLSATSRDLHILGARTRAPLKRTRRGQGEASTGRERVGGSDPADRRSMRRATDANIAGRIATMTQHLTLRPRRQEELQELSCNKAWRSLTQSCELQAANLQREQQSTRPQERPCCLDSDPAGRGQRWQPRIQSRVASILRTPAPEMQQREQRSS